MSEIAPYKRATGRQRGIPEPRKADNDWWYVHWSDGRRSKRASLGTKDEGEALKRFAQWLLLDGKTRDGVGAPVERSVDELWGVYMAKHVRPHVIGEATVEFAWKNLQPHFGPLLPGDVTQDVVDDYAAKRGAGRIGHPSKPITIRRELAYLIAALNFCTTAEAKKLLAKADVPEIRLPDAGQPRDRWLTMDEMQRLLNAAAAMRRGDRLSRGERFLWLGLETAARKEAILDLTWDRVDFETNVIHYDVPGRQQTKKRRAAVPISGNLRPVLERAWAEREGPLVMDNKAAIWATIQFIAIRAGFAAQTFQPGQKPKRTGISPHVLRHTAATHMARRGVPLWVIAKILGNTTAMVERVYAKWSNNDASDNVDRISSGLLEPAE